MSGPQGTSSIPSGLQSSYVSEWQLYLVLQRANLTQYYEVFIDQGGDDVHQLLEAQATEGEFLEIMDLVGMASKPLHVRRLQKALQEYGSNPVAFHMAAVQKATQCGGGPSAPRSSSLRRTSSSPNTRSLRGSVPMSPLLPPPPPPTHHLSSGLPSTSASSPPLPNIGPMFMHHSHLLSAAQQGIVAAVMSGMGGASSSASTSFAATSPPSHGLSPLQSTSGASGIGSGLSSMGAGSGGLGLSVATGSLVGTGSGGCVRTASVSPAQLSDPGSCALWPPSLLEAGCEDPSYLAGTPVLSEAQEQKLAECASEIVKSLPEYEPKMVQNKKKVSKDLLDVMNMSPDNPARVDEFRRYAAIYGRFDAKRKPDKPLTLHEVSVNEAAAQICMYRPALLTRRDELFPLARQAVRDSGYQYVKGQPSRLRSLDYDDIGGVPKKRPSSAGVSVSGSSSAQSPGTSMPSPTNISLDAPYSSSSAPGISTGLPSSCLFQPVPLSHQPHHSLFLGGPPSSGDSIAISCVALTPLAHFSAARAVRASASSGSHSSRVGGHLFGSGSTVPSTSGFGHALLFSDRFKGVEKDDSHRKSALLEVSNELQRLWALQEDYKRRVSMASEIDEIQTCQQELQRLAGRQMELMVEQSRLVKVEPPISTTSSSMQMQSEGFQEYEGSYASTGSPENKADSPANAPRSPVSEEEERFTPPRTC